MNVFLLLSLVRFGILWYTIGTVIVCTYIIRVALPLAKKDKRKKAPKNWMPTVFVVHIYG